jgi:hypothetical protein
MQLVCSSQRTLDASPGRERSQSQSSGPHNPRCLFGTQLPQDLRAQESSLAHTWKVQIEWISANVAIDTARQVVRWVDGRD